MKLLTLNFSIFKGSQFHMTSPNTKFIKRHEIGQNYKNNNSDIGRNRNRYFIFIILTDFVTLNKYVF